MSSSGRRSKDRTTHPPSTPPPAAAAAAAAGGEADATSGADGDRSDDDRDAAAAKTAAAASRDGNCWKCGMGPLPPLLRCRLRPCRHTWCKDCVIEWLVRHHGQPDHSCTCRTRIASYRVNAIQNQIITLKKQKNTKKNRKNNKRKKTAKKQKTSGSGTNGTSADTAIAIHEEEYRGRDESESDDDDEEEEESDEQQDRFQTLVSVLTSMYELDVEEREYHLDHASTGGGGGGPAAGGRVTWTERGPLLRTTATTHVNPTLAAPTLRVTLNKLRRTDPNDEKNRNNRPTAATTTTTAAAAAAAPAATATAAATDTTAQIGTGRYYDAQQYHYGHEENDDDNEGWEEGGGGGYDEGQYGHAYGNDGDGDDDDDDDDELTESSGDSVAEEIHRKSQQSRTPVAASAAAAPTTGHRKRPRHEGVYPYQHQQRQQQQQQTHPQQQQTQTQTPLRRGPSCTALAQVPAATAATATTATATTTQPPPDHRDLSKKLRAVWASVEDKVNPRGRRNRNRNYRSPNGGGEDGDEGTPTAADDDDDEVVVKCTKNGTASKRLALWDRRLEELAEFKRQHGHFNVPRVYPPNPHLHSWVTKQRQHRRRYDRKSDKVCHMTPERIEALDAIGFVWYINSSPVAWEQRLEELIQYKEEHGDCNVPFRYAPNPGLGVWVKEQKTEKRKLETGKKKSAMTPSRMQILNDLGFQWSLPTALPLWDERFKELKEYKEKYGDVEVQKEHNKALFLWVQRQRAQKRRFDKKLNTNLTDVKVKALEDLGLSWFGTSWEDRFHELMYYKEKHGTFEVIGSNEVTESLAEWVNMQKEQKELFDQGMESTMTSARIQALEDAGFEWT